MVTDERGCLLCGFCGFHVSRRLRKLLGVAGVPGMRYHDLRHASASLMAAQAVLSREQGRSSHSPSFVSRMTTGPGSSGDRATVS